MPRLPFHGAKNYPTFGSAVSFPELTLFHLMVSIWFEFICPSLSARLRGWYRVSMSHTILIES